MHCVFFHFLPNFKQRSYFSKAWVPNNSLHQRFRHRHHLERKDISVKKLNFHQLAELMGFIPAAKGWKGNRYNCFFSFRSKQAGKESIQCNKTCESTEVCIKVRYLELKWWGGRGFTNEKKGTVGKSKHLSISHRFQERAASVLPWSFCRNWLEDIQIVIKEYMVL